MTSGMAASCSQPRATVSRILGLSLSLSSKGPARPAAAARSTSRALAASRAGTWARRPAARPRRAWFLAAAEARAMPALAALAWIPSRFISSCSEAAPRVEAWSGAFMD